LKLFKTIKKLVSLPIAPARWMDKIMKAIVLNNAQQIINSDLLGKKGD